MTGAVEGNLTIRSNGPEDTQRIAGSLVPLLVPGDVLVLSGELGAGKTAFTQGLARAAGVTETVASPTFTLVRSYPTAIGPDLLHVDVYRLEGLAEIADLGLAEMLEDDAFAVIEWGERAVPVLGPEYLQITFTPDQSATAVGVSGRRLSFCPVGPGWWARRPALAAAAELATKSGALAGGPA